MVTARVDIGTVSHSWNFIIIDQAPYDVVVGLDLIRDILLYLDPHDLTLYLPRNPCHLAEERLRHEMRPGMSRVSRLNRPQEAAAAFISAPVDYPFRPYRIKGMRHCPPMIMGERCALFTTHGLELVGIETPTLEHLGVTASGDKERADREQLLDTVESDLRAVFDAIPRVLSPPDRDPPERAVKHFIFVDPSFRPRQATSIPVRRHETRSNA